MDLANLAYNGASHPLNVWEYGLTYGFTAAFFGLLIGAGIFFVVSNKRMRRATQFKGPALRGTAQVVSAGPVTALEAQYLGFQVVKGRLCRLGLRVEIPGGPPYDATVLAPLMQQGTRLAVWVDSVNPENVRIDFNQPIR
jgi:hypothetical protein